MYVFLPHDHISWAELVHKIGYFCLKFESVFDRKDTVLPMRGSDMLPGALPILFIHPRKVTKHSSSNVYLTSYHIIPFPMQRGCQKPIFCTQFDSYFWQNWHHVDHKVLLDAARSSLLTIHIYLRNVMTYFNSNICLSLQHILMFPMQRGYLKY